MYIINDINKYIHKIQKTVLSDSLCSIVKFTEHQLGFKTASIQW